MSLVMMLKEKADLVQKWVLENRGSFEEKRLYNIPTYEVYGKTIEKKPNYMTIPAAIRELDKIEMARQLDGVYRFDHAITATQKAILKAFGLTDGYVKHIAEEISLKLKTGI